MKFRYLLALALACLVLVVLPVAANGQSGTTLSATVNITPHWTTTYQWTIYKSVAPDAWYMVCGDTGTSTYTITVTNNSETEDAWVEGYVCVTNGGAVATENLAITAVLQDGYGSPNDFLTSSPVDLSAHPVLAPGETYCYHYRVDIPITGGAFPQPHAGGTYKVTADVTITNHSGHPGVPWGPSPSDTTVWPNSKTLINNEINVDDTNGGSWAFSSSGSVNYDKKFTCFSDTCACCGDSVYYNNTATIRETGQHDNATVNVTCYKLTPGDDLIKTVVTSFNQTYFWNISKSADQSSLTLSTGQQVLVNYGVKVDTTGYTDSDWAVSGIINITNAVPINLTINDVIDVVSDGIIANVDFGIIDFPFNLTPGNSLLLPYSAVLPDASDRMNNVTVTIQNYDYNPDGSRIASGTMDFTYTTDVKFNEQSKKKIDECINVTDTYAGRLGTVCIGDALPKIFTYSRWIGPYSTCGYYSVDNTASFTTKDTGSTGSDGWTVAVHVPCAGGCTLTPGYWKTHSTYGPAPYDDTWAKLPRGANTTFYLSRKNYYQVLWTPPSGGNSYYILSYQYIAAKLNVLNGASTTPAVDTAMSGANTFFNTYTPAQVAAFKPNSALRAQAINYAAVLSNYNSGLIGPGHCSE